MKYVTCHNVDKTGSGSFLLTGFSISGVLCFEKN